MNKGLMTPSFKPCYPGLYPLVDRAKWLDCLLPLGISCIQLRIKDLHGQALENEIKEAVHLAKKYGCTLFINDHWQEAIRFAADGVHLGQEDLPQADIDMIYQRGLYLGVSSHCSEEIEKALALNPSYIAFGPIYPTTSKHLSFPAQGLEILCHWREKLSCSLVAIGGITLERLPEILNTGVNGIAMISAITKAKKPLQHTKRCLEIINGYFNA